MMLLFLAVIGFLSANIALLCIFHRTPKRDHSVMYDTCIILGCPTRDDGKLSRMQKSRMNKAIDLYHQRNVATLLISGAGVRNDFIEAQVMADYAIRKGVSKKAILLELNARNTYDNLRYAHDICTVHHFQRVLIVTSRFHTRRSDFFVRKFFQDYAFDTPDEREKGKHYLAEYIRMWNTLRIEALLAISKHNVS